jgi:hypothetical protein
VTQAYPDMRKIINNLQLNTANSKLGDPSQDSDGQDYQFQLLELLQAGNLPALATLVLEQCDAAQISEVYQFLYQNLHLHPKLKGQSGAYEQCLVILNDGIYKHGLISIPHLNFRVTVAIKMEQALNS